MKTDPINAACVALLFAAIAFGTCTPLHAAPQGDLGGFGDPIAGQRLFVQKNCVRCHAVRGAGGTSAPDLGRKNIGTSFHAIAASMWSHSPGMTAKMSEYRIPHPQFADDEFADLVSFLYFLNYFDEPGDPREGKVLFTEKHCVRCHKVGQEGGTTGPALDDIPRDTSPLQLAAALWNHGPAMVDSIKEAGLEVPQFAGSQSLDLFAFVRSHGRRTTAPRFQSPGDAAKGELVFEDKGCSMCHPLFGDEPGTGPDLGRIELRGTVTQIAGQMWNHWPEMHRVMKRAGMSVPQFQDDELKDLFAYVYIARYRGEPGDAERGRAVFQGKGCSICHGNDGEGRIGPALRDITVGMSREKITQAMWNHAPRMHEKLGDQNLSWAQLGANELADLLCFLSTGLKPVPDPSGK